MKIGGFILSSMLHTAVIAGILYMPHSLAIRPDMPVMMISLTEGSVGGDGLPSPVLGHLPSGASPKHVSGIKKADITQLPTPPRAESPQSEKPLTKPSDTVPEQIKRALPQTPPPQDKPHAEPVKDVPSKQIQKQETDAKPIVSPKEPPKQEKAKPQPVKKADKKPPQKKITEKASSSLDEILKKALDGARSDAETDILRSALSAAEHDVAREYPIGGGGGEGDGEGGGGLYDIYAGQIILAVRPNWSMPTYTRDVLITHVRVRLASDGTVLEARIEKSSGRHDFNASAVNAVLRTRVLPVPPTPAQRDIVIVFNSLELMNQ